MTDVWSYTDTLNGVTARVTKRMLGAYDVALIDENAHGELLAVRTFRLATLADDYARRLVDCVDREAVDQLLRVGR